MFFHTKQYQYNAKPERPAPLFARKPQEVLGGQWGEISVMGYLFQGWNCRGPAKYRDMLSFMIARDTMHQNQWLAAIEELKAGGLEETPMPSTFVHPQGPAEGDEADVEASGAEKAGDQRNRAGETRSEEKYSEI